MNRYTPVLAAASIALVAALLLPAPAYAQWPQYSGQVFAIRGYAQGFGYDFVKTGLVYSANEETTSEQTLATVNHPGILSATALRAFAGAARGSNSVQSDASLANLSLFVGGNRITAGTVRATAGGRCVVPSSDRPLGGPVVVPGSSQVANLVINGVAVVVTGEPNQVVNLPNGRVIINEQQSLVAGNTAFSRVNALHVIVNAMVPGSAPLADIVFSSAAAYDVCECPGILYGAMAAGAIANVPASSATLFQSDRISGGPFDHEEFIPAASIERILTLQSLRTSMRSGDFRTEANVSYANVNLTTAGVTVTAGVLDATALSQCAREATGWSRISGLTVNGVAVTATGEPNQTVSVGNARVVVNEQRKLTRTGISVVAVHVYIYNDASQSTLVGDVQLGATRASVTCGCL